MVRPIAEPLSPTDLADLTPEDVDRVKSAIHDIAPWSPRPLFADACRIYLKGKRAAIAESIKAAKA